jgi:protein TonB
VHRAPAPASPRSVQSPPVRRPALQPKPDESQGTSGRSASLSLGNDRAQRKAEEDYFWQIVQKISQYRYYARSRENTEQGIVVTRMTIARDGRLLDVSLMKSSGFPNLDNGVMEAIRRASPFAPLPADVPRDQQTFVVPISYKHER